MLYPFTPHWQYFHVQTFPERQRLIVVQNQLDGALSIFKGILTYNCWYKNKHMIDFTNTSISSWPDFCWSASCWICSKVSFRYWGFSEFKSTFFPPITVNLGPGFLSILALRVFFNLFCSTIKFSGFISGLEISSFFSSSKDFVF